MGAKAAQARAVAIVASGNFLEMYDFQVFGFYAAAIGAAMFPKADPFAQTLFALMTFGAGFLMRPIGGLLLGAYLDRHGRRRGLLITLGLMAVGTLTIAFAPPYAAIGVAAPILVLAGRLVQGLSAGVELGGVSVYLAEIAPPGRKGFYVAWQSASQQVAVILAAAIGIALTLNLPKAEVQAWGWRIPFLVGCALIPFLVLIRRQLTESPAFAAQRERPTFTDVWATVARNWPVVVLGMMLATLTTVTFYMITNYTPTFGTEVLHLSTLAAFTVTLCVGVSNLVLLPVMGAVGDRIGRGRLLIAATLAALLTGYGAMRWLAAEPSFGRLLAVELWFSLIFASYNGAMVAFLTEVMPPTVRTCGFSVAYSLATALFGGFTPAISHELIHRTGDKAAPGLWLTFAALLSLLASVALLKRHAGNPYGEAVQASL
jgi:MFS family permease